MNGYTYDTTNRERLFNLAAQVPQKFQAEVLGDCLNLTDGNPNDLENVLTGYVRVANWQAFETLDAIEEQERQAAEVDSDNAVFGSAEWFENIKPIEF